MEVNLEPIYNIVFVLVIIFEIGQIYFLIKKVSLFRQSKFSQIFQCYQGDVKVSGVIERVNESLLSPFFEIPCVHYQMTVSEQTGNGESKRWSDIFGANKSVPYKIVDSSGSLLVDDKSAQYQLKNVKKEEISFFGNLSPKMYLFLKKNQIDTQGILGNKRIRITEEFLKEGESAMAMGSILMKEGTPILSSGSEPLFLSNMSQGEMMKKSKQKIFFHSCVLLVLVGLLFYRLYII